ncbi:hypothetical protein QAD02_020085 [Eretmocerus hayati]|uniref:Uncharacterized protein n=1 Tax=Eretmocerus hayati TaxID=131215 RepID=A0ACC2PLH6_9HYME|nr:hypothetical protein QAD02_020085 [Eretmocerus hayati]
MMASRGAIKKTVGPSTTHRTSRTRTSDRNTDDGVNESIDTDKRTRIYKPQLNDAESRRMKSNNVLANRSVLPDKNVLKLGNSGQKVTSRLELERSKISDSHRKEDIFRKKSTNSTSDRQINGQIRRTEKDRTSTLVPPDRASDSARSSKISTTVSDRKNEQRTNVSSSNNQNHSERADSGKPRKRLSSTERRKSRTLSPSEIKVLHTAPIGLRSEYSSKDYDNSPTSVQSSKARNHGDANDSEDYESDFEGSNSAPVSEQSDLSVSSLDLEPIILHTEKMRVTDSARAGDVKINQEIDSGHFEVMEARRRSARVESLMTRRMMTTLPLPETDQLISQTFRDEKHFENKSLPSSTDEGFEDSRSGDFVKSLPVSSLASSGHDQSNVRLKSKKSPKPMSRGQALMQMIKLDAVEVSLYESKPISYEEFIRTYGKFNTQQISTQTNEDNLNAEVQTDPCECDNKWTQFPVKCRNNLKTVEDVRLFKMEHIGVGGDETSDITLANPTFDVLRLDEFLGRAGKLVLALLEEKESGGNILQNDTHEFPFSDGFIKLSVGSLSFLCGRLVTMLSYSEIDCKILVSIHAPVRENKATSCSKQDHISECCIGCIWNINEPSKPVKLIYSQSPIRASCFHTANNDIFFAGLEDGSICLWDLQEDATWHQKIKDKIHEMEWTIRSPTYTTAGSWEIQGHSVPVVALRVISKIDYDRTGELADKYLSIQICSLDEEGSLIIWSVLRNFSSNPDDFGVSQWGKVKLVKSQEVPLFMRKSDPSCSKRIFVDMNVDSVDSNNLYLAINDTSILFANCIGARSTTPYYKIKDIDSCGNTTCIEVCPFRQSYFLAGCTDGSIRLHSQSVETPLLQLKDEDNSAGIKCIQWSKSKSLTIYVLDDHSRIVVWDLSNSDIHPTHTISTKNWGHVNCMRLSPCQSIRDRNSQYLAVGTDTGNVEVHKLKQDFHYSEQKDISQEINTFLRYVSIL